MGSKCFKGSGEYVRQEDEPSLPLSPQRGPPDAIAPRTTKRQRLRSRWNHLSDHIHLTTKQHRNDSRLNLGAVPSNNIVECHTPMDQQNGQNKCSRLSSLSHLRLRSNPYAVKYPEDSRTKSDKKSFWKTIVHPSSIQSSKINSSTAVIETPHWGAQKRPPHVFLPHYNNENQPFTQPSITTTTSEAAAQPQKHCGQTVRGANDGAGTEKNRYSTYYRQSAPPRVDPPGNIIGRM